MMTQSGTTKTYTPTIGIEVHAELQTKSKMFCGCPNDPHGSEPNANVCPVCLAHPGTLPVPNKEAARMLLMIGNAVKGDTASFTEFDRKNYFYPDIPKGYQISQYAFPFVRGGTIADVALTRIHLEEDTARSQHDQGSGSAVDFNRAGVPLMELVTEPTIHDAASAAHFTRELQLLLRTLGVSHANMERGEMRVEANISVSDSEQLGTKVEVKNLNSFKAMEQAIQYEIRRQSELLEKGDAIVQETRGWDENRERTFTQRVKETAEDYRYFPDPDIPKMDVTRVTDFNSSRIAESMPKLPEEKRVFYTNIGIPREQVELIVGDIPSERYFSTVVERLDAEPESVKLAGNYLTSDVFSLLESEDQHSIDDASVDQFAALISMVKEQEINSRVAKDLLPEVLFDKVDPAEAARERGLLQMSSDEQLLPIVEQILKEYASVAEEYKAGKEASLQFLIGQGMKATRGSADPARLSELIKERLN